MLITVPPSSTRFLVGLTVRVPALTIAPGCVTVNANWFGVPTNAEVYVLGLSHAEFGPYGLRREFVLIDEIAIWKQITLKTG